MDSNWHLPGTFQLTGGVYGYYYDGQPYEVSIAGPT